MVTQFLYFNPKAIIFHIRFVQNCFKLYQTKLFSRNLEFFAHFLLRTIEMHSFPSETEKYRDVDETFQLSKTKDRNWK